MAIFFLALASQGLVERSVGSFEYCTRLEDIVTRCMFGKQMPDALEVTERITELRSA